MLLLFFAQQSLLRSRLDVLEGAGPCFCEEGYRSNNNGGSPFHCEQFRRDTMICCRVVLLFCMVAWLFLRLFSLSFFVST